ncbi:MAG: type II toxin-antitoxin system RelE/ParE family toxin [Candidatus Paceibacterota bacterium]
MNRHGNKIQYHPLVVEKDIPKLDPTTRKRIKISIEKKLTTRPEIYGAPLRANLRQYWKLRIGDYRVVYSIKDKTVYILLISHRKDVYLLAENRKQQNEY